MNTDNQGIYDARQLGKPKFAILGIQHLFAMFGATILVPLITGLDVSATLLFAGIGTLIFHLVSKLQVPAFLGSSFAFLGGYASVKQLCVAQGLTDEVALNYACIGVAAASLLYFVMAFLLKMFGTEKVMRFFPPVVTGPMVIAMVLRSPDRLSATVSRTGCLPLRPSLSSSEHLSGARASLRLCQSCSALSDRIFWLQQWARSTSPNSMMWRGLVCLLIWIVRQSL